jgi:RsiW-degrading membrane proteinase PrsW (M82 family)
MLLTIFLAVAVPFTFLYLIHWLDLYGSDRPRVVVACVAWGLVAFLLSFVANHFCIDILGLTRKFVSTRTAPFVEELFKAGILIYLLRWGKLAYFVDGAIYGFAVGMGFAAIENLRYIQLFPANPFALVVLRDFSSALAHGTATALTGIAIGWLALSTRGKRQRAPMLIGLSGAMTLHCLWNNFGYYSPLDQNETEWVLVGVGLAGVAFVAATIMWGMHRERQQLRESLGLKVGVSEGEASIVQHMGDLDHLLAPVEKRFGRVKRRHVAEFLHLEAQLGLDQQRSTKATDPVMRAELNAQIANAERKLDAERRKVGVYVMLYVRSIFPETRWSLWARLGQTLTKIRSSESGMWPALASRIGSSAATHDSMYSRMQAWVEAGPRGPEPTLHHVKELPEAMQRCVHWVMKEVHATAQHAAAGLGHHEAHAKQMLNDLVARGFLHRMTEDGKEGYRARVVIGEKEAAATHLWHSLASRMRHHIQGSAG